MFREIFDGRHGAELFAVWIAICFVAFVWVICDVIKSRNG